MKNLNVYFNKKLISYVYLKQINIFTEMVIFFAVGCKNDTRQTKCLWEELNVYEFSREENLKDNG